MDFRGKSFLAEEAACAKVLGSVGSWWQEVAGGEVEAKCVCLVGCRRALIAKRTKMGAPGAHAQIADLTCMSQWHRSACRVEASGGGQGQKEGDQLAGDWGLSQTPAGTPSRP